MATYAIGDIQGCYSALMRLLDKLAFDPAEDRLWLAGDLVSRGEDSLSVLRLLKQLDKTVDCVLGNHDISLLAMHYGVLKPHPSLLSLLNAPDREELIIWLSSQPLIQVDEAKKLCLVHAGLPPKWKVSAAQRYSQEIQQQLQSPCAGQWLARVYGDQPKKWKKSLTGDDRHRYILNAFTRMRFLEKDGALTFRSKQSPKFHKRHIPWFAYKKRKNTNYTILFGHWASLGFYQGNNVIGLDTGCVWGNALSAIKLDDINHNEQLVAVSCKDAGKQADEVNDRAIR